MSMVEGSLSVDLQLASGSLERLRKQLTDLERGISLKIATNPKGIHEATRAVDGLNVSAQRAANSVTSKLGGAAKATAATFGVLAAAAGGALIAITTKAILAGKEFNILQQGVRASLTAILGTSQAAETLLANVNRLNDTSPFPRSTFLSATQQLVGFGVQANKVTGILDSVQEAVAGIGGDSTDIQRFARLFAQIQSQGRLTGDVLFSLGEKGIDAATLIGDQMGKTGQQIKDEVTKGTIGADQAIDLLTKGLKTKFNGAVENVGKSFVGAQDRVTARLRDIGADLTKAFIDPLGGGAAVDGLNNIAVGLSNIRKNVISQLLPGVQSLADLFVKATDAFKNFTANIKTDSIQKFLDIFKMLSPLVALVGTSLIKSLGAGIPIISTFTGALSGPVIALTLFAATVPAVREAVIKMVEALRPAVEVMLPALVDLLTSSSDAITTMAPLLTTLAGAFAGLVAAATPLLKLLQFGPVQAILTALIAKFLLMKLAGSSAFQGIAYSALQASAAMKAASFDAAASGMGRIAGAAKGVGSAIGSLITPTNLFLVAIGIAINKMAQLKGVADEAAASTRAAILEGLSLEDKPQLNLGVDRANKEIADLEKKLAGLTGGSKVVTNAFDPSGGFGVFGKTSTEKDIARTEAALKSARKTLEEVLGKGAIKDNIISDVMAITGLSIEDVTKKAAELGIVLTSISGDAVGATVKKIADAFTDAGVAIPDAFQKIMTALTPQVDALDKIRAATDKVSSSERALAVLSRTTAQEFKDGITKATLGLVAARRAVGESADRVKSAEIALAQAKRGVAQADERLIELTKERNALLADTNAEARELADAEAGLARSKAELIDQIQREEELRRNLADLAREGPEKLAAADRAILRAKIALNNATREQKELQEELNKEQAASPDLTGLSLDQIKTRLAGARAQLAVQRATKNTQKSTQEIEDEGLTAKLNVIDAEQAHKDAIQARADLELDLGIQKREDEEALQGLQLDHEASLRRQEEQQITLSKLRAGDTETARTLKRLNEELILAVEGVKTSALGLNTAEREVLTAKDGQLTATLGVRDAEITVRDAKQKQLDHAIAIRDAQKTVGEDARALKELTAETLGDNAAINRLLLERLGINTQLLQQNPGLIPKIIDTLLGAMPSEVSFAGVGAIVDQRSKLTDILLNHPDQLLDFLRGIGFPLAKGGLITKHTFAQLGEGGRPELVLPLTNPQRTMTLLAQSIPKMHTALQRRLSPILQAQPTRPSIQDVLSGGMSGSRGRSTRGVPFVSKADGPVTYGQLQELITLVKAQKSGVHVEAPITVGSTQDEERLARKISSRVEKKVYEILSRR